MRRWACSAEAPRAGGAAASCGGRTTNAALAAAVLTLTSAVTAGAEAQPEASADGTYGRLDGDLLVGAEVGITETIGGPASRGESLAARLTLLYLSTAGLYGQYNESFGVDSQPIARAVVGGVEIRPLFLGRWAKDLEHGPAYFDLWLDSISLSLGLFNLWRHGQQCGDGARVPGGVRCHDFGMEASLGMELPLLPRASTPFIALRGGVRWSLDGSEVPDIAEPRPDDSPIGLVTLTLGYHHLFETHLVDAADQAPP